jgi:hypothetical protein
MSLKEVQTKVEEVKIQMGDNMQKLLVRGEELENLEVKSLELEKNANIFKRGAVALKRKMCCQHYKYVFLSILIVLIVIVIILALAGVFSKN